ncbi:Methylcrotonoyl-CoA carboxylase beta chain, mitochondrial [Ascosphaera pollenicola]|nr:Methylcrotonoyl-CoA carboxylase beta chain, mitochondrial [Ascosphaera pollenicola]
MADVQKFMLVADSDKVEASSIASSTAQRILSKETGLIDVVQSLGDYINDEDAIIRGKAVSFLTAVITSLPDNYLSRQQIHVLTEFFCDRIQDGGAIAGLDRLQSLNRFTSDMTKLVARALFDNHEVLRKRSQSQRFQMLTLLNNLMSRHRKALHSMGEESLVGVVNLVTGERDPRNLMITFSIIRVVIVEWEIAEHVDLLFESVYNYFPITFKPPPNDPYKITAEDLKDRLQDCLSSTSLFAPYLFPALIDKLDSTSVNVKKDTINALGACAASYDASVVSRYSLTIWDALKFEILNVQEEILSDEAKKVLRIIAQRLSEIEGTTLTQYLKPIVKECDEQLQEPLHKQAKPAQEIVKQLASASTASFKIIVTMVISSLFKIYENADTIAKRKGTLDAFLSLFAAANEVYKSQIGTSVSTTENPLAEYREQILEVLSSALMGSAKDDISFRVAALRGFLQLSTIPHLLLENELELFVKHVNEILLLESLERPQLKKEALVTLSTLSTSRPSLIINLTFPALISTLPDQEDDTRKQEYLITLDNLAKISVEKTVFETLVRRLLSNFNVAVHASGVPGDYPAMLLKTILVAMEQHEGINDLHIMDFYFDKIVVDLSRRSALAAIGKDSATCLLEASALDILGRILNFVMRHSPAEAQDRACENVYTLFAQDDGFTPVPVASKVSDNQRRTMILSTYILAGLPKTSKLPDVSDLVQKLVSLAAQETDTSTQTALSRHMALLVNKFTQTADLASPSDLLFSLLNSNDLGISKSRALVIFWLSKALVSRLAPKTPQILEALVGLLRSPDEITSVMAAQNFELLIAPDYVFSTVNGANIRLLAKQRVFSIVVPVISEHVRGVNSSAANNPAAAEAQSLPHVKTSLLTALMGLIAHIPSSLLVSEMSTLLPLFLQTLDLEALDSVKLKLTALNTLSIFIEENGINLINEAGYIEGLVKRLLKVSTVARPYRKTSNPPRVRVQALRCLRLIAKTPAHTTFSKKTSPLLPLKDSVIYSLKPALDDPKRDLMPGLRGTGMLTATMIYRHNGFGRQDVQKAEE